MYRASIISADIANRFYGCKGDECVLIVIGDGSGAVELRRFATHRDALSSESIRVLQHSMIHAFYGVDTTDILSGRPPQTYEELCTRLGVVSDDQQAADTAMMLESAGANTVQQQIGETRPEQGRQTSSAMCAKCGNVQCTCEVTEPGMSPVSAK